MRRGARAKGMAWERCEAAGEHLGDPLLLQREPLSRRWQRHGILRRGQKQEARERAASAQARVSCCMKALKESGLRGDAPPSLSEGGQAPAAVAAGSPEVEEGGATTAGERNSAEEALGGQKASAAASARGSAAARSSSGPVGQVDVALGQQPAVDATPPLDAPLVGCPDLNRGNIYAAESSCVEKSRPIHMCRKS